MLERQRQLRRESSSSSDTTSAVPPLPDRRLSCGRCSCESEREGEWMESEDASTRGDVGEEERGRTILTLGSSVAAGCRSVGRRGRKWEDGKGGRKTRQLGTRRMRERRGKSRDERSASCRIPSITKHEMENQSALLRPPNSRLPRIGPFETKTLLPHTHILKLHHLRLIQTRQGDRIIPFLLLPSNQTRRSSDSSSGGGSSSVGLRPVASCRVEAFSGGEVVFGD